MNASALGGIAKERIAGLQADAARDRLSRNADRGWTDRRRPLVIAPAVVAARLRRLARHFRPGRPALAR